MSHCVPNWGVESLATHKPPPGAAHAVHHDSFDLVPWFDGRASEGKPDATARDAVVPCAVSGEDDVEGVQVAPDSEGGSTRVGSCSGPAAWEFSKVDDDEDEGSVNASSFARVPVAGGWGSEEGASASLDVSYSFGEDNRRVPTTSSCEWELSEPMTTSFFSLENTSSGSKRSDTNITTPSDGNRCSLIRSRKQRDRGGEEKSDKKGTSKSSIPTERSRCRANKSQRKRREKIDHNVKKLQRLVPTSKTDKDEEWVLDEVIKYVKQLQGQVHLLMSMMMPMPMMPLPIMPMPMPQQVVHMPMMPDMPMGMGSVCMGMGHRQNLALPCLSPAVYMPAPPCWNVAAAGQLATANPQSRWPMTVEAHRRMASLMQQQHPFIFQNGNFF